jgi:hypothetical protein
MGPGLIISIARRAELPYIASVQIQTTLEEFIVKMMFFLLLAISVSGCALLPRETVNLDPGAESVRVAGSIPPFDYEEIGVVFASDGSGCGAMGARGNYPNAEARLKNKAFAMGAGYVKIQSVTEPHAGDGCFYNELKIYGNAYKKRAHELPAPLLVMPEKLPNSAGDAAPPEKTSDDGAEEDFDVVKKLRELKTLRDEKIITEEEYQKLKTGVLEEAY